MTYHEDLGRLAVFSAITETKLREGRYKTIDELSLFYDAYMDSRLETLNPEENILHEGSLKAYDCTLELITGIMDDLDKLDADIESKERLKETLRRDYKKVKEMKERFSKRLSEYNA